MEKPVFSIQWHLTAICDQRCKHCYLFNSPEAEKEISGEKHIDFKKIKAIADDLNESCKKLGAKPRVSLTGGDPILHPYFWRLLDYLKKSNIKAHIMGNPFHITNNVAKKLFNLGITKYQLSLDGMEKTHDIFRKQGSFSATVNACDILKSNGIAVSIMSTVSKINAHEIPELIDFVVSLRVDGYSFARYCPTNNDTNKMFNPEEYKVFLGNVWQAYSRHFESKTKFILKDHLWTLFLVENGLFKPKPTKGIVVDGCGLGVSHLSVLADGTVFACRRFNSPVGKVPDQSLYDIFINKTMNEYRDLSRLVKCKNCELLYYCRGCMAVTYGSVGDWTQADPQCWKKINL